MESSATTGKIKQPRGPRRIWTHEEEKVLVQGLKELLGHGWKADNGFRGGYATLLEKRLQQHFPGTDIKVEPHISSKMKVWKKHYGALINMQGRTGFGWDDSKNMITVEGDDIWEAQVKADVNARGLRFKSWPFFKDWVEIFGRDRASGERARSFADVVNNVLRSTPSEDNDDAPDDNVGDDMGGVGVDSGSATRGECSTAAKKTKGKKRRNPDDVDAKLVEFMGHFCARTGDLALRVGHQLDAKEQRAKVCEELAGMPFLTVENKIDIARRLCESTSDLDIFCCLPVEERVVMVKMMLEKQM